MRLLALLIAWLLVYFATRALVLLPAGRASRSWPIALPLGLIVASSLGMLLLGEPRFLLALPFLLLPPAILGLRRIANPIGRLSVLVVMVCAALFAVSYTAHIADVFFAYPEELPHPLPTHTRNGNPYHHDTLSPRREQGHRVDVYRCDVELRAGWAHRSPIPFDSVITPDGQTQGEVLTRYLASMGHRRDSVGLTFLTPDDVQAVEAGCTAVGLRGRGPVYTYIWRQLQGLEREMLGDTLAPSDAVRLYRGVRATLDGQPTHAPVGSLSLLIDLAAALGWGATLLLMGLSLTLALLIAHLRACWWLAEGAWVFWVLLIAL